MKGKRAQVVRPTPWIVPPIVSRPSGIVWGLPLYGRLHIAKNLCHIFPRFIKATAEANVLSYSGRGQILRLRGRRRNGNPSHHHRNSSWAWEEASSSPSTSATSSTPPPSPRSTPSPL